MESAPTGTETSPAPSRSSRRRGATLRPSALTGEILYWSAKTHLSLAIRAATRSRGSAGPRAPGRAPPSHPRADDAAVLIDLARRASAADKTNQELKNEIKKLKEAHIKLEELERKKRN